ncbi:MAG: DUF1592 domain-containing protein [Planctomyces sp.]|nr:DUF1592 domain-containing protein [Planctomyces sp.]
MSGIVRLLLFAIMQIDDGQYQAVVQPFLNRYCLDCHGPDDEQAGLRVDRDLNVEFVKPDVYSDWSEAVNALNSHQMPPEEAPQPSPQEVAAVVDWAIEQATQAELEKRESRVVMRRLNRTEYRNAIRDLTGVEFDTASFPQDPSAGGFDNNGSALNLSPMQLELYYDAAQSILEKALILGPRPRPIRWRAEPESGDNDSNRITIGDQRPIVNGGNNPARDGFRILHHSNWDKSISFRDFSVPVAGPYQIRIRAAGVVPDRAAVMQSAEQFILKQEERELTERPQHEKYIKGHYQSIRDHFRNDRMYDYGPPRLKVTLSLGGQPKVIGEFDVDADVSEPKEYIINADFNTEKAGISVEYAYDIPKELENFAFQTADEFARPEAWVDYIELEGPVHEVWPPESSRRIMIDGRIHPTDDRKHAATVIRSFMERAFRRPVTTAEVEEHLALYDAAAKRSRTFVDAMRPPLTAILVSPQFLFLAETTPKGAPISDYELASRLSMLIWNTIPDETLLKLASQNQLHEPATLSTQLDRMLADARSDAFVESFAGQWLGLREIGANPPAVDLYRHYDRHLEISMREESLAFFRELLKNDLSVMNFVDSEFLVINERMARFYEISDVRGDHFRRVPLPANVPRGGIMSQASFLTITSNGTRTSPVKRGTWILKNVLGTDPGLPVANAGEIAPTVPGIGKATVRKRLELHRELPQCARCHNKIDPLGLALENFDASGRYREREGFGYKGRIERDDPPIDASSQLPNGRRIDGLQGLQSALLEDRQLFLTCLTGKLFSYSLGRELTLGDQKVVQDTVAQLDTEAPSLREILRAIVTSSLFLRR